jgi:predicted RNA-binding protein YlxR (DUF448 family)
MIYLKRKGRICWIQAEVMIGKEAKKQFAESRKFSVGTTK